MSETITFICIYTGFTSSFGCQLMSACAERYVARKHLFTYETQFTEFGIIIASALAWAAAMCVYIVGHSPLRLFNTKQAMINKYSNKHNLVENPYWREAGQLAIYKHNRDVELGACVTALVINILFQITRTNYFQQIF